MALLSIFLTLGCTLITILVAPGVVVLVDRTVEFLQKRRQLVSLLDECETHLKKWILSRTEEEWQEGAAEILRLYHKVGRAKEGIPVVGGGKATRAEHAGPGSLMGTVQGILLMIYLNAKDEEPTADQKEARRREIKIFSQDVSHLKRVLDRLEGLGQYQAYLSKEVARVYLSLGLGFIGLIRRSLRNRRSSD